MPTWSETPIYLAKCQNDVTAVAASSIANYTIFTPDSSVGGAVTAINVYSKGAAGAVTGRLEIVESATAYILWRGNVGGAQYSNMNLLKAANIPFIDDNEPMLRLEPGQTLRLAVENSVNNALDVIVAGGSFLYPNP